MTKQLVTVGTAIMTTLLALIVVWQFHIVIVYVLISLALAATVRPLITNWTRRTSAGRIIFVLLFLICLGVFGFLTFLVGKFALIDIQKLTQTLSVQGAWRLPPWLEDGSFQKVLIARLPTPDKLFQAVTGEQGQLVLPALLGFTEGIGGVLSATIIILFLSLYWSINQIHFERLWLSLLPSELRKLARGAWRTIEPDLGAYIRSEVVQSLLASLLLGIGYWLLGSQYSILLALIGGLAWLMPVVGAALAVILPLFIGLLTSPQLGLLTTLYTLVVLVALQVWVEPRFFKRKWDNPILTLIILLAMADAFGLLGILVAPPLSAACQILWSLLVSNRLASGAGTQVSDLKTRQAQLKDSIAVMDELPPPLVASSMERLDDLLEKAGPILQATLPTTPDLFHSEDALSASNLK
ncbi:MAG: AI-2E family transporter [Chloroflexota bacterium]